MNLFLSNSHIVASALRADSLVCAGRANRPGEPSSVGVSGDRGDVVTNDIMFSKVSQSPVFTTAVCAVGALSLLYIIFIIKRYNVIMSSAPICRGFIGDVMVTLSLFVPFCLSRHSRLATADVSHAHLSHACLSHSGFQFQASNF